jgi:hypothetical protein
MTTAQIAAANKVVRKHELKIDLEALKKTLDIVLGEPDPPEPIKRKKI